MTASSPPPPLGPQVKIDCVLDARGGIGESPVWSPIEQVLWWVEILEKRLHRFDPVLGVDQVFDLPSYVGCVALSDAGGVVVALQEGLAHFDASSEVLTPLDGGGRLDAAVRYNDGVTSPQGDLLVTTMQVTPPFDAPVHGVSLFRAGEPVRQLAGDLLIGNGLAFSPDGRTAYLSDSHPSRRCIWAFDWDGEAGELRDRRLFFQMGDQPGHPDGAAIDVDGGYWFAAAYGWSVVRLTPDGQLDRVIPVPLQKPTKPAFGGPDLDRLYLTSIGTNLEAGSEAQQPHAGGLLSLDVGLAGLAPTPFRTKT